MILRTTRYQAAIIDHDHILLLKVISSISGRIFWEIPGGGQEPDESEETCVVREVMEETCLDVEVVKLILDERLTDDGMYQRAKTYHCRVVGGEVRPGCEPEIDTPTFASILEVGWFDLHDPQAWDELVLRDPITYPLLQRIRSALGYTT